MPHRRVADQRRQTRQPRNPRLHVRIVGDRRMGGGGADRHRLAGHRDAGQPQLRQIHHDGGLVQPLLQHRDEGLAAGERLGFRGRAGRTASARLAGFT